MADKCNIIRDSFGKVEYTEAPNGQRSRLYDDLAEKLGDRTEALKVWLTTKTDLFKKSILNPIISNYKSNLAQRLKEPAISYYRPRVVKTKSLTTIFLNKGLGDTFFPIIKFKVKAPARETRDKLREFLNQDKVLSQGQLLENVKADIQLLQDRKNAEEQLEKFEELIIPVLGRKAVTKDLNALQEQALLFGDFFSGDIEALKNAMKNAEKGLDPDGNPSELALRPSEYNWGKGINLPQFEKFVKENPAYKGVFDDWKRLFDKSVDLTLRDTKGLRSYKVEPLLKLQEYLESGDKFDIVDANTDPSESVGRIRFKESRPGVITVDSSLVQEDLQGQGIGTQLYIRLFQWAAQRGLSVESSDKLTAGSEGVWKKLVSMGLAEVNTEGPALYAFRYSPPALDTNGEVSMGAILNYVERASRGEYIPTGMTAEEAVFAFHATFNKFQNLSEEFKTKLEETSKALLSKIKNAENPNAKMKTFQRLIEDNDLIPYNFIDGGWNVEYKVDYAVLPKKTIGVDYTPRIRFAGDDSLGFTNLMMYDSEIANSKGEIIDENYTKLDEFEIAKDSTIDPNYVYRGISEAELKSIRENGYIKSNASMNIGDVQADTTSYAQYPNQAFNYASWFSAWYDEPGFNNRKYVLKVSRKGIVLADTELNKRTEGEIDVANNVGTEFIEEIFEVRVVSTGVQDLEIMIDYKGNVSDGSRSPGGRKYAIKSLNKPKLKGFENEMKAELKDMMLGLPVTSSSELQTKLKQGFYSDGYFNPTRTSLENTGLYRSEEITELLTDEQALNNVKDFMYDLEKVDTNVLNDIYADENYLVVKEGYKNRMGTFILANPYLLEQEALDSLAGVKDRDAFEKILHSEDQFESLRDIYWDLFETKEDLFYKFKNYTRVAQIEVEDGQLSAKTTNTRAYLNQVLQEPKTDLLETNIDYLIKLDGEVYNENRDAVDKVIKLVQKGMTEIGLDVTNLDEIVKEKTIGELKGFLGAVQTFLYTETPQAFDNLVGEYDTFFKVDDTFKFKAVQISEAIKPKNSFFLRTSESPIKLFKEVGLIPIGKNVYKRFAKDMNLDMMYDRVYRMMTENGYASILSEEAFRPTGYDADGTINLAKITNPENREAIIRDIKAFIQSQVSEVYVGRESATAEELERYVLAFNYINRSNNINKFNPAPSIDSEFSIFSQNIGNQNYLQTDFIADFNVKMLKSKALNDLEYQEFFSNFAIAETGLILKSNDPITLSKIDKYLDDNQDLVNYLRLHKQGLDLRPSEEQVFKDDLILRNYYANFPAALPAYKGNYTKLSEGTLLADTKDEFIRTKDGLFELHQGIGGKGIYTKLETNDGEFKIYSDEMTPAELDIEISEITAIETSFNTETEINNTYSQEEKDQIDNEEDNC